MEMQLGCGARPPRSSAAFEGSLLLLFFLIKVLGAMGRIYFSHGAVAGHIRRVSPLPPDEAFARDTEWGVCARKGDVAEIVGVQEKMRIEA